MPLILVYFICSAFFLSSVVTRFECLKALYKFPVLITIKKEKKEEDDALTVCLAQPDDAVSVQS